MKRATRNFQTFLINFKKSGFEKSLCVFELDLKDLDLLRSSLLSLGLLGEEDRVDVGENTTRGDGHVVQQLVELLVVSDGELDVSGHDSVLLVVSRSISGELEDLSSEVLKNGGEVDWGTSSNSLSVSTLSQMSVNSTNRELETSSERSSLRALSLLSSSSSLSTSLGCGLLGRGFLSNFSGCGRRHDDE